MAQHFSSQSTDSFRELLAQAQCTLLISTYQAGQLVVVRAQERGISTHFLGVDRPMGIARRENEFAVGGENKITIYRNLPAVGSKAGQGDQADACYLPRRIHHTGSIDVHEMGYDATGKLWFVNTKMSCLAKLHEDLSYDPQWRPPFISAYDLTDRCHLNGLGFRDGKPRYVSMLGESDSPAGWRQNKVSGGAIMDIDNNELLVDGLCMPHSPRWYRDRIYFLSSGEGRLMSVLPGQAPELVVELPGFARGMDFIDQYAVIGLSQIRESSTFAGLPLTKRVDKRQSGVWVVDLERGEIVAYLVFTGNVQEVFDVKLLGHRWAAVVDESSPLLSSSFELADRVLQNLAPVDRLQALIETATQAHLQCKFDRAIEVYRKVLDQQPDHRHANHQLGTCLLDAGRWQQAIDQLTKVIASQPDNAEAMNSLAMAWQEMNGSDKAMTWLERSIVADNQFALAHFNRGILLLRRGEYEAGWPEYDWRWQTPSFVPFQCDQPQWQGEDIRNKRLLIHSEQGDGDHIQYFRFLSLAAERCKELIYVGPEYLAPLVAEIPGVSESRVPGRISEDRFDVWCPLMSLTRWLGITLENLPAPERYLQIPANAEVQELTGEFKVGFVWSENATGLQDEAQQLVLAELVSLFALPGVSCFSLQMPIVEQDREFLASHGVQDLAPESLGYARTAAMVNQLDLVISVDSTMVHVAGALGIPTWVLLSDNPHWRWLETGETSPWYPSLKLYRRAKDAKDWSDLIRRIRLDLIDLRG